jgi:hypothetical protein
MGSSGAGGAQKDLDFSVGALQTTDNGRSCYGASPMFASMEREWEGGADGLNGSGWEVCLLRERGRRSWRSAKCRLSNSSARSFAITRFNY